ncbi:MAG: tetratricopeptide repeat protein [Planctomycetes bacterium]|nr:tetratricopeptide repeat protein [Planctomycetota bacterium]
MIHGKLLGAIALAVVLLLAGSAWAKRAPMQDAREVSGEAKEAKGEFEGAIADFTALIQDRPLDWRLRRRVIQLHLKLAQGGNALAQADEYLKHRPQAAEAHGERGDILYLAGQSAEATAAYRKALELSGGDAGPETKAWAARLWVLESRAGDRAKATENLRSRLDGIAADTFELKIAQYFAGWWEEAKMREAAGIENSEASDDIDPGARVRALHALGVKALLDGRRQEAAGRFEAAAKMVKGLPGAGGFFFEAHAVARELEWLQAD